MKKHFWIRQLRKINLNYKKLSIAIAVVVVFVTTYALILPALTLDNQVADNTAGVEVATVPSSSTVLSGSDSTASAESGGESVENSQGGGDQVPEKSSETAAEETPLITEDTVMSQKGEDYEVVASFGSAAQLPQGVELKVSEINSSTSTYQSRYNKAKEALGVDELSFARFFDISFIYNNQEVEPAAPVTVKIKTDTSVQTTDDSQMKVVHFLDDANIELVEAQTNEENNQVSEISFGANSFSDYGVVLANYYTVNFIYQDSDGREQTLSTLVDKASGSTIGTLPETPFKEGYSFSRWVNKETGETVDSNTVINSDMTVEAVFTSINIYTVTVEYFYHNNSKNTDVTIDKETVQLEKSDTPYQITPPSSTEVSSKEDTSLAADAIYYPEQAILEYTAENLESLDAADGVVDNQITQRIKYVPYTAEYDVVYMLKDLEGEGYSEIQTVRTRGVLGSTVTPQILTYAYANYEKEDTKKIDQASGQKLYVYYTRKTFTLSYNSNGGTNIDSQSALYGGKINLTNAQPTKVGYTFSGWYDNASLTGSPITGEITLDDNKTLYAKWTPKTVDYVVAYYKEVYDNSTGTTSYVYDSSKTTQGSVGAKVSASDSGIGAPPSQTAIGAGYEIDNDKNATSSIEIEADGTSVLNVYYKLIRYTFIFDLNNVNGRIAMNGATYSGTSYRITDVVLGQDVSSVWPSSTSNPTEVYDNNIYYWGRNSYRQYFNLWSPNYKTKRYEVTADMLPSSGRTRTFTANWTRTSTESSVEYWLQQPDGSYQRSSTYSQSFINSSGLTHKDIFGYTYSTDRTFTANGRTYTGTSGSTYRFYYTRNRYNIDYYYGSDLQKTSSNILYEADIANSTYNYQPQRPSGVDDDYTWGGWYADSNLTTKYNFDKMPSNNLALYANWVAPNFTVSFDTAGADSNAPASQTISKYKYAEAPEDPKREHYNFLGWYTSDGKRFEWDKQITEDVKLTARWELKPLTYTVKYLEEGSNAELAADKVVTSPSLTLGQSVTEDALAITGYRPSETSSSIQLDYDENTLIFYYSPKVEEVTYTIRYVLAENETIEVAPSVTKTADGSIVRAKESAPKVDKTYMAGQAGVTDEMLAVDYYPTENTKALVLTSNAANNVITFKYANYNTKTITINYLDMDGNQIDGQESSTVYQKISTSYILNHKAIEGYTYDHSKDSEGVENSVVYKINDSGTLTIDLYYKKNITFQANNKSKDYDGKSLESVGLTDLSTDYSSYLKPGDKLDSISYEGTQTNAGVGSTTPKSAKIVDTNGENHTDYYNIIYSAGTLTVDKLKVEVTIDGDKVEKTYDGLPSTVSYQVININNDLYKESDIIFSGSDSEKSLVQTDAGTYDLVLTNRFVNKNDNFDVSFKVSNGRLYIKPRKVTLSSASDTKAYDGTALTARTVSVSPQTAEGGFIFGEGIEGFGVTGFDVTGSQTEPGSSKNTFTYTLKENTKTQNYDITVENGTLTVTPTINLQKTNLDWLGLAGGQFEVNKWDGASWSAISGVGELEITTADAGVNIPVGLTTGLYRIRETAAPDGYVVLDSYLYFLVTEETDDSGNKIFTVSLSDESGNTITTSDKARLLLASGNYSNRIQIANEVGRALPHTGGSGTFIYIIIGVGLMLVAFIGNRKIKHNHERSDLF